MLMKIKLLLLNTLFFCATINSVKAQALFNDNFDAYSAFSSLSNDPTGSSPGQGNWFVTINNSEYEAKVDPEANKGNVLGIETKSSNINGQLNHIEQKQLANLWNARTVGNNILKFEFEFYIHNMSFPAGSTGGIGFNLNLNDTQGNNIAQLNCDIDEKGVPIVNNTQINGISGFGWTKAEIFIDYNTKNVFYYIPSMKYSNYISTNSILPVDEIRLSFDINGVIVTGGGAVRFDEFQMSALQTLPTYLNVDEFIAEKFNIYPNPTNDIVNVTSTDDVVINEIVVHDLSNKKLKELSYKGTNQVQINMQDLSQGVYILTLKTNKGITVKKIAKK